MKINLKVFSLVILTTLILQSVVGVNSAATQHVSNPGFESNNGSNDFTYWAGDETVISTGRSGDGARIDSSYELYQTGLWVDTDDVISISAYVRKDQNRAHGGFYLWVYYSSGGLDGAWCSDSSYVWTYCSITSIDSNKHINKIELEGVYDLTQADDVTIWTL